MSISNQPALKQIPDLYERLVWGSILERWLKGKETFSIESLATELSISQTDVMQALEGLRGIRTLVGDFAVAAGAAFKFEHLSLSVAQYEDEQLALNLDGSGVVSDDRYVTNMDKHVVVQDVITAKIEPLSDDSDSMLLSVDHLTFENDLIHPIVQMSFEYAKAAWDYFDEWLQGTRETILDDAKARMAYLVEELSDLPNRNLSDEDREDERERLLSKKDTLRVAIDQYKETYLQQPSLALDVLDETLSEEPESDDGLDLPEELESGDLEDELAEEAEDVF